MTFAFPNDLETLSWVAHHCAARTAFDAFDDAAYGQPHADRFALAPFFHDGANARV